MVVEKLTIPAARKLRNMTQKDLANACGVSESTVTAWEKYRREPSVSQAMKIAQAVGLRYDDLIFLPDNYG